MSIKATTELLTNPLKMQQFELQNLLIKELRRKWKTTLIAFILGVFTVIIGILIQNILTEKKEPLDVNLLLNTVTRQTEIIQTLTNENTNLKLSLKDLGISSNKND